MQRSPVAVHLVALASLGLLQHPAKAARASFDLGVDRIEVSQTGGTTLFHDLRVACVVSNHGPGIAPSKVRIVLTRPAAHGRKLIKTTLTQWPLGAGKSLELVGRDSVWHAATVPYRCAIDYGPPGALRVRGDHDASNDLGQATYPTP